MLPPETRDLICRQRLKSGNKTINKDEGDGKTRGSGGERSPVICWAVHGFTSIIHDA